MKECHPRLSHFTVRRSFVATGAVTGIGSLPLTSTASAIRSVAEFSPEVPFWPQLPQLSERESIVGQGLGVLEELIEPRNEGYGYQVKEGQLNSVLEILHRRSGELTPENAAGFGAFEEAFSSSLFSSAVAVKGQTEGSSRCRSICSTRAGPSYPIQQFLRLLARHSFWSARH